jgi:hypothetical protein
LALETILQATTLDVARDVAVAATHDLFKVYDKGDAWGQTAWVPYRNGLLILTGRYIAAPTTSHEVGWRFSFIKQNFTNVYIKKDLLQGDGASPAVAGRLIAASWFVTTFIGKDQLSETQRRYSAAFEHLLASLPPERCTAAYRSWFDPDLVYREEGASPAALNSEAMLAQQAVIDLLQGPDFRALPRGPVAQLLDADLTSKQFAALPVAPRM